MSQPIQPIGNLEVIRNLALGVRTNSPQAAAATPASAPGADAAEVSASLAEIKTLLAELDRQANALAAGEQPVDVAQSRLDQITASIDAVVNDAGGLRSAGLGFTIGNIAPAVAKSHVYHASVDPGESVDVNVILTQSAQLGNLFLSLGGALDLSAADARFTLEIAGVRGARTVVFASGTTQADIIKTINSFTDATGVSAITSGTGVRLTSIEYGDDQFVSVRVIDSGGLNSEQVGAGVYHYARQDANTVSAATAILFSDVSDEGVRDDGQDIAAVVNGVEARTDGRMLSVSSPELQLVIALQPLAAQTPGAFTAFTITGAGPAAGDSLARQIRHELGLES